MQVPDEKKAIDTKKVENKGEAKKEETTKSPPKNETKKEEAKPSNDTKESVAQKNTTMVANVT